jgi:peroxiredoxin 2/4
MTLLIGKPAPAFKAMAAYESGFKQIDLTACKGQYVVLFFYPLDFTFVCPTELHAFQDRLEAFKKLGVTVLACSVDSHFSHKAWLDTPREKGGICGVQYGIISDIGGKIAEQYDVLNPDHIAYRALFLIDKEGIVRHQSINDLSLGRNVDEVIRLIEALQHVETHGEVCPANWNKDQPALKATQESVAQYLSQNQKGS